MSDLVLGYDFGSTAVKAALFDAQGRVHASRRAFYPTRNPGPGAAEQDPRDWWRAMGVVTRALLADVPQARQRVAALGIAAQMCGCIAADAQGEPLHPCLIWSDSRSAGIAREITAGGPRLAGYGAFALARWLWLANGAPSLQGRDPLSKMLWLRRERPRAAHEAAQFLDVKDWLLRRCVGRAATTADIAQLTWLMDNRKRRWSERFLARFEVRLEQLPDIIDAAETAGGLTREAAAHLGLPEHLPVSGGAGDVNAAALGAGDLREGAYHLCIGTSLWAAAHSRRRRVDVFTGTGTICAALPDRFLVVATDDHAGSAVNEAAGRLGFGADEAGLRRFDEAASTGSQAARAVLEGVSLKARRAFDQARRCVPAREPVLRVTGGGAHSTPWMRITADVIQRPLQPVEHPLFAGARGAAMTAATVAGWFARLESAQAMARVAALIEPDAARRAWADDRYGQLVEGSRNA